MRSLVVSEFIAVAGVMETPGTALLRSLLEHDLVDGPNLLIHPLVLGNGKRLSIDGSGPTPLSLVDFQALKSSGFVSLTYRPAR
jgi:riboflavin biosynthesis pyrimidine reductase